ncbi:YqgE/AlgH family protein [Flavobacteriaceae bacterium]|nr:YqgE/AlgH family protein [Flavobacteriaceae bacterium]MDC1460481.1 YqgE/AlgH family protein [Flavobacteriaceae bacterium]
MKINQGTLLVAEPSIIGDINFHRSVILLANHKEKASLGFILNKPFDFILKDILPEINSSIEVHYGGPVEPDNLYFIHNSPELITGSIKINEELYWGGNFEKVIELLNDESIGENNIRFFLGYSGWGENQLKNEIELNSWIIQENCIGNKVININSESFWRKQIRSLGGPYLIWGNAPENPSHN